MMKLVRLQYNNMYILSALHQVERQYVVSWTLKPNELVDVLVVMLDSNKSLYPSILKAKNNGVPNNTNATKKTGEIYMNIRFVQENPI